jgi:hypothetical protein
MYLYDASKAICIKKPQTLARTGIMDYIDKYLSAKVCGYIYMLCQKFSIIIFMNKYEVIFLFGSGISIPSGLSGVMDITDSIFTEPYFEHTDQSMIRGEHPSEYLRNHYDVKPIQNFLQLIREKCQNYFRTRLGENQLCTYEDLYFIADQIISERKGFNDNLALQPFIDQIAELSFTIRQNYTKYPQTEVIPIEEICEKSKTLIETVVKYGLWDRDVVGLDSIASLVNDKSINKSHIFTLNHDTLLEKLFSDNCLEFSDGFSVLDGEVRFFEPESYDSKTPINIYHLHGARNWYWVRDSESNYRYAILTGEEKWYNKLADGKTVDLLMDKGNLLTGANKSSQYHFGIFGELFFRFQSQLRKSNRLVVSGFGWNDLSINNKLYDWLESKPDTKLLLIHGDIDSLIQNSRYLRKRSSMNIFQLEK